VKAEYIAHSGSDLTVVNSARVSFDKESSWVYEDVLEQFEELGIYVSPTPTLAPGDVKLIKYLAAHKHFTPFTHATITLRETVPIFVARQRFKHTIGFSYNEISRRYVDKAPEFYYPDAWRKRHENKKQGSSLDETVDINTYRLSGTYDPYKKLIEHAEDLYKELIALEVSPEMARMVLPQSMYTSYYVTGSLAAFARAYNLRSSPDSQLEIQYLAKQWADIIGPLYPISWEALCTHSSS